MRSGKWSQNRASLDPMQLELIVDRPAAGSSTSHSADLPTSAPLLASPRLRCHRTAFGPIPPRGGSVCARRPDARHCAAARVARTVVSEEADRYIMTADGGFGDTWRLPVIGSRLAPSELPGRLCCCSAASLA